MPKFEQPPNPEKREDKEKEAVSKKEVDTWYEEQKKRDYLKQRARRRIIAM